MSAKWKRLLVLIALAMCIAATVLMAHDAGGATATASAGPSPRIFMQVTGQKQGLIAGAAQAGKLISPSVAGQIPVYAYSMSGAEPVDSQSGLPTGRRIYKPVSVTIAWSNASIGLIQAMAGNENLKSVVIDFYEPYASGKSVKWRKYTEVRLVNAEIVGIDDNAAMSTPLTPNGLDGSTAHNMHMETVRFAFQQIEWINATGSMMTEDDWQQPNL